MSEFRRLERRRDALSASAACPRARSSLLLLPGCCGGPPAPPWLEEWEEEEEGEQGQAWRCCVRWRSSPCT